LNKWIIIALLQADCCCITLSFEVTPYIFSAD
jgi:hypothetical protein